MEQMITAFTPPEKAQDPLISKAQRKLDHVILNLEIKLHEFTYGFNIFQPVAIKEKLPILTNGKELYFSPEYVLETGTKELEREILHITLHGILGHFSEDIYLSDPELSWAVMDLKVDRMMHFLLEEICEKGSRAIQRNRGKEPVGMELYYRARKKPVLRKKVIDKGVECKSDDHNAWRMKGLTVTGKYDPMSWEEGAKKIRSELLRLREEGTFSGNQSLEKLIEQLYSGNPGVKKGGMTQDTRARAGRLQDYRSILDALRELGTVSTEADIPDPIFYSYGLELYEDMPLVEPMEEAELPALENLVIAVDTSGSCLGHLDLFLTETRELLRQLKINRKIKNLYFLECDSEIQRETKFEGENALSDLGIRHSFSGGGGTDFCPVFKRIAEYEASGQNIQCLIYYSDCHGSFPENPPDYPCFFIDPENDGSCKFIPKWVQRFQLS